MREEPVVAVELGTLGQGDEIPALLQVEQQHLLAIGEGRVHRRGGRLAGTSDGTPFGAVDGSIDRR